MADNQAAGSATPPTPDPAEGAKPGGQQQQTPEGAKPDGTKEGARPDTSLGDAGRDALEKERAARRDADRQLAETRKRVAELEDAGKSETDRTKAELERATARINELEEQQRSRELLDLKREVATEAELPPQMAARLQGTDLRTLRADAKALREALDSGQKVGDLGAGRGGGAAGGQQGRVDMNQLIREAAGR